MSEHLKVARNFLNLVHQMTGWDSLRSLNVKVDRLTSAVWEQQAHLEAQQETPASETSSAPTTGPAVKRYGSAIASLATSPGRYHLTVETGDSSKSISFTSEEWAAIRQHFSVPWSTSVLPTAFIGKPATGGRGVAVPDSPASSPEPAQGGSEETHPFVATDFIDRGVRADYPMRCQTCGKHLSDAVPEHPSRTMKEGSERG